MMYERPPTELLSTCSSLPIDFLTSMALGFIGYNSGEYDTVWDLSNRICDRFLPLQGKTCCQTGRTGLFFAPIM